LGLWERRRRRFCARRQKGAAVAYVLKYRTVGGKQRWHTIGKHGAPWTPDLARAEAKRLLGDVVEGLDPAGTKQAERRAETVADPCEQYRRETAAGHVLTRRTVNRAHAEHLHDCFEEAGRSRAN
jgi:hypothetical protein